MPRAARAAVGGIVYHVLNRGNARLPLFESPDEYALFLSILAQAHDRVAMRTIGYCLMPNHWHLVLRPREDGDLSEFMRWLTVTHTQRWHAARGTPGSGHLYQGRFKSFPVQAGRLSRAQRAAGVIEGGDPVLSVLRYVERNPLRAGLATRVEAWPWSSLHQRTAGLVMFVDDLTVIPDADADGSFTDETADIVEDFETDATGDYGADQLFHDAAGNLTYDGQYAYAYDAWNRLVAVNRAYRDCSGTLQTTSRVASMRYDALGRRISKVVDNSADWDGAYHYYYDGQRMIETRDDHDGDGDPDRVLKQYVWGGGYVDELVQIGINDDPADRRQTETFDNGREFAAHERIAALLEMDVYFAHPYSSWERGTNENTNGLLRQYLPKGERFDQLTDWQLESMLRQLNDRPRKCLNYRTPAEVFWRRTVALEM
ncbi:MAG: IS30 family transposase [Phycisphaerae bacterium]|nr:IS30 family transposase [Phycisphaerae bacterium]